VPRSNGARAAVGAAGRLTVLTVPLEPRCWRLPESYVGRDLPSGSKIAPVTSVVTSPSSCTESGFENRSALAGNRGGRWWGRSESAVWTARFSQDEELER